MVEAVTITGPVKPLLMFSKRVRNRPAGQPQILHSIMTTVRSSRQTETPSNLFLDTLRQEGLDCDVSVEGFPGDPRVLGQIAAHIRKRKPDIVETHDFKSHFLFWLLRRLYRRQIGNPRWIAYHHGYTRMSHRVRAYQLLDRISLPRADLVVTLCRPFVEQVVARGVKPARVTVISNAVEPRQPPSAEKLLALRHELGLDPGDPVILAVGRLSPEKGCDDLIAAFRRLRQTQPDLKLLFVGDGGEGRRLRDACVDLGPAVIFAGHQTDAWPYFFLATVYALPSHSEGSPLVLFEALSAQCIIVASCVGGVPDVVTDGFSALLVLPHDVSGLTEALGCALTDPSLRGALQAGAAEALDRFTPDRYVDRLLDIYGRLIGK
ncbi:MAG: hypothetical protein RLZZ200_369 [Pseudomonadota bacterium]|jgi:glycosyltransferase involved in cell wall biosynthesis